MTAVALTLNGRKVDGEVEPRMHLADFIREHRDLTGTHLGCEHGVCGACTVVVDGMPMRSCITFTAACDGAEVTTIEGLDDDEIAGELRAAFSREHALQCGYCTPGMLVSARDLVVRLPDADERAIRLSMSGNLCRCTGYVGIVRAIVGVIADRRARGIPPLPGGGRTALGPAGSGHGPSGQREGAARRAVATLPEAPAGADLHAPVFDPDWQPQATFDQTVSVPFALDRAWAFFGRIDEVAACLPGVALSDAADPNRVAGQIRVRLGPISAEFKGVAAVARDEANRSGRIQGQGSDARSRSATRGEVTYRLAAEGTERTRVEVSVGYTLTGLLAQFGRSGLVEDVARRLTAAFAENVGARLGDGPRAPVKELSAASLVWSVLWGRVRSWFGR